MSQKTRRRRKGILLGAHVSISGSIDNAVDRAFELGCDVFQVFTRTPRRWAFADLDESSVEMFSEKMKAYGMHLAVVHMPYIPNLAAPDRSIYTRSLKVLKAELYRCGQLGIPYLVTHLGSHRGKGLAFGQKRVAKACNRALSEVDNQVTLLLENTAGTKNSLGSSFEHIRAILDNIDQPRRVGVCFDTSHAFAAGYDLRNATAVRNTMKLFDEVIGSPLLHVIHLNDSKVDLGRHADRHEHIGLGFIGDRGFKAILGHETVRKLPLILETPVDNRGNMVTNLRKVRELAA